MGLKARKVLKSGSAKDNYHYVYSHPDADIKAHEQAIIDKNDAYWAYRFAREIKGADVKALGQIVVRYGTVEDNYEFARHVKDADIKAHGQAVIDSGDAYYNYTFANNIPGADREKHGKAIVASKDAEWNYLYARDIPGADIKAHAQVVIESKNASYNYSFARDIPNVDISAHAKVVIDSADADINYEFAKNVKGANIRAHGQAVIDSGNVNINYEFAKDVKGANIRAHGQVVIDSGDVKYNYEFAKNVKGADIEAHREVVEKNGIPRDLKNFEEAIIKVKAPMQSVKSQSTLRQSQMMKDDTMKKWKNPYNLRYDNLDNDALLKAHVDAGQSVFLHGPSGVGKSARVKQLDPTATRITLRPQMNPEEIDGTLNRETGEYIPPLWYTQLCEKCKAEPDRKHILFIDELTNVKPTVQSLVYSIVLDRAGKDGLWPLPENAVVVGAGNENADNLAAYPMTNALYRRFCHINYDIDVNAWVDWALQISKGKKGSQPTIHPLILAYVIANGESVLNQELDEENPKIVTDPRKWEIASKILYATKNPKALIPALGEELTASFVDYTKKIHLTVEDVINGQYDEDSLGENLGDYVLTIAGLVSADEEQLGIIRQFINNNYPNEILALYDSMWVHNDPERAVILQECKDAMKIEKQKTKMQQSNIQDVMELIYDN